MHAILLVDDKDPAEGYEAGSVVVLDHWEVFDLAQSQNGDVTLVSQVNVRRANGSMSRSSSKANVDESKEQTKIATTAAHALLNSYPALWDTQKWVYEADIYLPEDLPTPIKGQSAGLTYALFQLEHMAGFYKYGGLPRFPDLQQRFSNTLIAATGVLDQSGQVSAVNGVEAKFRGLLHWVKQGDHRANFDELICFYPADTQEQPDSLMAEFLDLGLKTRFLPVSSLHEAVDAIAPNVLPKPLSDTSPYQGLAKFTLNESALFFGREASVKHALSAIEEAQSKALHHQHLVVFGDSGTGKSSFVESGLLPHWSNKLTPIVIRPADCGGEPLEHIVAALQAFTAADVTKLDWQNAPEESVHTCLQDMAQAHPHESLNLVIDQAEELIIGHLPKAKVNAFIRVLCALTQWKPTYPSLPFDLWVFSSIRSSEYEDYLSLLKLERESDSFIGFQLQKLDARSDIDSYQRIIEEPARAHGIKVEPAFTTYILSALTELEDPLPHLQYALDEFYRYLKAHHQLNEGFTLARYKKEIGSIGRLLHDRADQLHQQLMRQGEDKYLYDFFDKLLGVEPKQRLVYQSPCEIGVLKTQAQQHLVSQFGDYRLISQVGDRVRFTHELLIREWGVVQEWATSRINRRRRRAIRNLTLGLVTAVALMVFAGYSTIEAEKQRDIADQQRIEAEKQRDKQLVTQSRFLADLSQKHLESGNARLAALLAMEGLPDYSVPPEQRRPFVAEAHQALYANLGHFRDQISFAFHDPERDQFWFNLGESSVSPAWRKIVVASDDNSAQIHDVETGELLMTLKGHTDSIRDVEFSPNGSQVVTTSKDHTARLWDVETGKALAILGDIGKSSYAEFSPGGDRIIIWPRSGEDRKGIQLWDVKKGKSLTILQGESYFDYAKFSSDGTRFVTSNYREALIHDSETGEQLLRLAGHARHIKHAEFSPDGQRIVTASSDHTARLWDAESGKVLKVLIHTDDVNYAEFSPDGSRIVTASENETAHVWDTETGIELAILNGHSKAVHRAAFSFDGKWVFTTSIDGEFRRWSIFSKSSRAYLVIGVPDSELRYAAFAPDQQKIVTRSFDKRTGLDTTRLWFRHSEEVLESLIGHNDEVEKATYSPDSERLLTTSEDNTVRIWGSETGEQLFILQGHKKSVRSAEFSTDGQRILTASSDNTARLWNAATGEQLLTLKGHTSDVYQAEFSPDGQRIVTASADGIPRLWDAETGEPLLKLIGHTHVVFQAEFSPDGRRILTVSGDWTVHLWDSETGEQLLKLEGHTDLVEHAEFSPNGQRIVTASWDHTARLWDAETGEQLLKLEGHTDLVDHAEFSPDGQRIVTASWDHTARLWDAESGKVLKVLSHADDVNYAEFSPDGRHIVTASEDQTGRLWDTETGIVLAVLKGHSGTISHAAFSADGQRIVTSSADGSARQWRVFPSTEKLVEYFQSLNLPPLTTDERQASFLE